jgi:hypothetical protein
VRGWRRGRPPRAPPARSARPRYARSGRYRPGDGGGPVHIGTDEAGPSAHSVTAQPAIAATVAGTARERRYRANGLTRASSVPVSRSNRSPSAQVSSAARRAATRARCSSAGRARRASRACRASAVSGPSSLPATGGGSWRSRSRRQPQRLGQVRPGGKHQDLPQALAWTVEVREEQVDARPGPVLFTPGQSTANHDQVLPRV